MLAGALGTALPKLTFEATAQRNLARKSGDGVPAGALGTALPKLTFEATAKGNLGRKTGDGLLVGASAIRRRLKPPFPVRLLTTFNCEIINTA